jgi:predicted transcriptional regulator
MQEIRDDAIGSFNAFLEEQQKIVDDTAMTVVLFDDQYEILYNGTKVSKVKPFTMETFVPRGTTALYDAIGRTIAEIDARVVINKAKKDNVTIAVLTDGHENASREFNREKIFNLIKDRTEKKGWDFIYLSAEKSVFDDTQAIGIDNNNVAYFCKDSDGTQYACNSMSKAMVSKRRMGRLEDWK